MKGGGAQGALPRVCLKNPGVRAAQWRPLHLSAGDEAQKQHRIVPWILLAASIMITFCSCFNRSGKVNPNLIQEHASGDARRGK